MPSSLWQRAMILVWYCFTSGRIPSRRAFSRLIELTITGPLTTSRAAAITAGSGLSIQSGKSVAPCTVSTSQQRYSVSCSTKLPALTSI